MMFAGVALFGAATVVFGLSSTPWVSIAALVVMGAADMVSVYVRETLIALWTPDKVRGRVNAVNMVFVGRGALRRHRWDRHAYGRSHLGGAFSQASQDR